MLSSKKTYAGGRAGKESQDYNSRTKFTISIADRFVEVKPNRKAGFQPLFKTEVEMIR